MVMAREHWQRFKLILALSFLVMLLMRLIWTELRTYSIETDTRALITARFMSELIYEPCARQVIKTYASTKGPVRVDLVPEVGLAGYWFASPALIGVGRYLCVDNVFKVKKLITLNQWTFIGTTLLCALLVRFLTGSWTIGLFAAVVLMSRGRLISGIGVIGTENFVSFACTLWFTCIVHFIRTGSLLTLIIGALTVMAGALFDQTIVFLNFAMPVFLGVTFFSHRRYAYHFLKMLRKQRKLIQLEREVVEESPPIERRQRVSFTEILESMLGLRGPAFFRIPAWHRLYERGRLFSSTDTPFCIWAFFRDRWIKLVVFWIACAAVSTLTLTLLIYGTWLTFGGGDIFPIWKALESNFGAVFFGWLKASVSSLAKRFDLQLTASLACIIVASFFSPIRRATGFVDSIRVLIAALIIMLGGAFVFSHMDAMILHWVQIREQSVAFAPIDRVQLLFQWMEPVILSCGIASIYFLLMALRVHEYPLTKVVKQQTLLRSR